MYTTCMFCTRPLTGGELWRLERAWEEAEEIAAIADNLLLPRKMTGLRQVTRNAPTNKQPSSSQ